MPEKYKGNGVELSMEQPRKHPTEGCVGPAAESVGVRAPSPKAAPTAPPPLRSARPQGKAGCSLEEPEQTEEAAAANETLA